MVVDDAFITDMRDLQVHLFLTEVSNHKIAIPVGVSAFAGTLNFHCYKRNRLFIGRIKDPTLNLATAIPGTICRLAFQPGRVND